MPLCQTILLAKERDWYKLWVNIIHVKIENLYLISKIENFGLDIHKFVLWVEQTLSKVKHIGSIINILILFILTLLQYK